MPNLGPTELIILLVIVLLLFGAKRIPELAKGLGTGMREFKNSSSGKYEEVESDKDKEKKNEDEEVLDRDNDERKAEANSASPTNSAASSENGTDSHADEPSSTKQEQRG